MAATHVEKSFCILEFHIIKSVITVQHAFRRKFEKNPHSIDKALDKRALENDQHLMLWPPRSPDLTQCVFFLCGYIKDRVFIHPTDAV